MKPNIDLTNPFVSRLIEKVLAQGAKALDADRRVENAVFPIYALLNRNKRPEHIGSCVAVRIKEQHFLFSASHVFDVIGNRAVLVGMGNGNLLSALGGDRFSSAKGPSGTHIDDPVDASVFHILSDVPAAVQERALSLADFDTDLNQGSDSVFCAAGFRCNRTRSIGNKSTVKYELLPSGEYGKDQYTLLNIDPKTHLALGFDDQVLNGKIWQKSPTPKGFSGGAIIRFSGLHTIDSEKDGETVRPLLAAITIEQRRQNRDLPGVLIGTRIGVHLGLISQYLPGLWSNDDLERPPEELDRQ